MTTIIYPKFDVIGNDIVSMNTIAPSNDPGDLTILIDLNQCSYNGDNFKPQSVEIDLRKNFNDIDIFFDGYFTTLMAGTITRKNIFNTSNIIISPQENIQINFYKSYKNEGIVNIPQPTFAVTRFGAVRFGDIRGALQVVYNSTLNIWKWKTTNKAPLNVSQDCSLPIKILDRDLNRLHIGFYSDFPFCYAQDATQFDDANFTAIFVDAGTFNMDSPMFYGDMFISVPSYYITDFYYGGTPPANNTTKTLGLLWVEYYAS